ncbi:MAG: hypothetical protein P4L50_15550 [Anaerolineaceae bacterium]|nr:hypothetical protein [Anaerolineaceae bacterium]
MKIKSGSALFPILGLLRTVVGDHLTPADFTSDDHFLNLPAAIPSGPAHYVQHALHHIHLGGVAEVSISVVLVH